jgi:hypothetical protein
MMVVVGRVKAMVRVSMVGGRQGEGRMKWLENIR